MYMYRHKLQGTTLSLKPKEDELDLEERKG